MSLIPMLSDYSVEVTSRDRKSLETAALCLSAGTEVFIAALPGDSVEQLVSASVRLKRAGLVPIPHVVARNLADMNQADALIARLTEVGVGRALILGGDRDQPAGSLTESLQIIESGILQRRGVRHIFIGCYPEGHPKISDPLLDVARRAKLKAAADAGLDVTLISQFSFEAAPIIDFVRRLRKDGATVPFRVGVAGPANRALLLKYAMICGVGASMRFVTNRPDAAKGALTGETPAALLTDLANANAAEPSLGLSSVHFFTFGSLLKSAQWANSMIEAAHARSKMSTSA